MEGLAEWVYRQVAELLEEEFQDDVRERGLKVRGVQVWEDSKNRCTYREVN
jgi:hypothetical protein